MNPTLRNKLFGAIAGGSGAIAIASVMLGNADGLEGRRYYAYQDVVGVWTVCDGHTGTDIRRVSSLYRQGMRQPAEGRSAEGGKCH